MKRNKNNIFRLGILTLFILSIIACDQEEFLENVDKANLSDVTQWESNGNADIFLNDVYSELPNKWNTAENLDYYTDDYNISHYYTASNWRQGVCLAPSSSTTNAWFGTEGPTEGYYSWVNFFVYIRKANTFIQKIEENKENFSTEWYNKRMDEAKFIRAFFYSEMFMHYGGLPVITTPLDRNTMEKDELLYPRETFGNTFDFIVSELESIVNNGYLPVKYNSGDNEAGHATLGAALALKGWIELFAASELFNSGTPYLSDPDNVVHFASPRSGLYAQAAATNKKFIDQYGDGQYYELFDDIANLWRAANEYNSEVIWDRQIVANVSGMGANYERRGGPTYVLGQYMTWG